MGATVYVASPELCYISSLVWTNAENSNVFYHRRLDEEL